MIVYRALTEKQYNDYMDGKDIIAKNPNANRSINVHVAKTMKDTQWISTTKEFFMLFSDRKGAHLHAPIARIDTEIAEKHGVQVFDISTDELQEKHGVDFFRAKNFAKGAREVLLLGSIPPEACTLIVDNRAFDSVMVRAKYPSIQELLTKYLKTPHQSYIDDTLFLRERINHYGQNAKGPMSRYKLRCVLELVHLVSYHQAMHTKTKWYSISVRRKK